VTCGLLNWAIASDLDPHLIGGISYAALDELILTVVSAKMDSISSETELK